MGGGTRGKKRVLIFGIGNWYWWYYFGVHADTGTSTSTSTCTSISTRRLGTVGKFQNELTHQSSCPVRRYLVVPQRIRYLPNPNHEFPRAD